ncbi:MAG: sigma-54-dependent Fis family transcriptional regulator [Deferrisomatales bacterium]
MLQLVRKGDRFEMVEKGVGAARGEPADLAPLRVKPGRVWQRCSPVERRAWDCYVRKGTVDPALIRASILRSWERCREAQVNPTGGVGWDFAALGELEKAHYRLLEASEPITETLGQCVRGTGMVIVLTDPRGYILQTLGEAQTLGRADRLNFGPGANWSETSVGTNAIGTALALGRAIEVTGTEHFCETHHLWTCSAAPVRDPHGRLVGCLDISGPRENAHPHIMGMVLAAVRSIENRLRLQWSHERLAEEHEQLLAVLDTVADGILTVGADGRISNLNRAAAELIGRPREEVVGRPARSLLGGPGAVVRVLQRESPPEEREVTLDTPRGPVRCTVTARPLPYGASGARGAVIGLRERRSRPAPATPLPPGRAARYTFADLVAESPAMAEVVARGKRVARSPSTVLLLGESGTGKELLAQAIHNAGDRRAGPFVAVNCAAIPKDLIQSELFGYEVGAFTGAHRTGRPGKFEAAHGGTLFLDEIGDMPLEMQSNLLRVLEERVVVRLGGAKARPVDVRLIAATHEDLRARVEQGTFRRDIYYRLSVITLALPPLRDRPEDVPPLVEHHLARLARKLGLREPRLHPRALEALTAYAWPGNVRELVNVLEQALHLAPGEEIDLPHLAEPVAASCPLRQGAGAGGGGRAELRSLASLEKWAIEQAIIRYRGNLTRAAKTLGIGRNTLYDKIRKYGIRR